MSRILPNLSDFNTDLFKEFAQIELIAADLDGTLIQSNKPEVWQNIQMMVRTLSTAKYKIDVVIATGRTLAGAKKTLSTIYQRKNLPIILYNGSVVIRHDDFSVLYKKVIGTSIVKRIVEELIVFNTSVFAYYYLDKSEFLFDDLVRQEYVLGWTNSSKVEIEFNKMPIIWDIHNHHYDFSPSAILIDLSRETMENRLRMVDVLTQIEGISITSSGFSYIEIRPAKSDKAKALEFAAEYMNVERRSILAIGDNDNDAEMLAWAGIGVSMSNATSIAKENSNYECNHDVASGFLEVLRIIKSAKRYYQTNERNT